MTKSPALHKHKRYVIWHILVGEGLHHPPPISTHHFFGIFSDSHVFFSLCFRFLSFFNAFFFCACVQAARQRAGPNARLVIDTDDVVDSPAKQLQRFKDSHGGLTPLEAHIGDSERRIPKYALPKSEDELEELAKSRGGGGNRVGVRQQQNGVSPFAPSPTASGSGDGQYESSSLPSNVRDFDRAADELPSMLRREPESRSKNP